jgi:hypothetical protein
MTKNHRCTIMQHCPYNCISRGTYLLPNETNAIIDNCLTSNILLILLFVVDRTLLYMTRLYDSYKVSVLIRLWHNIDDALRGPPC